jgi:adenylate cyclase
MFTDMVGSTAMAQVNESATLRLRDEQEGLVRPLFVAHQGREIKSMGDGFLVEFDSALRAVQCAIDIQQHLHERNSQRGLTPIELRIGVHLGDVEQRGNDIFGDAVNIASRIEPLAPPRGVCISGEVFSQVRNKIPNRLEKLPSASLKGVQVAIDVYRVELPWSTPGSSRETSVPTGIAVLPFANISLDSKDEYFADGLTEELITELSQLRGLRVIARTSVMQYKATSKPISQIGAELGVTSVLEGSVRKSGDRLRITAQLIDVATQGHTWAKSYDRELTDVFAVQGEIARQVAASLRVELSSVEGVALRTRVPVKMDSYLAYLKGRKLLNSEARGSLTEAKEQFERAIALDDRNAAAYSGLADAVSMRQWYTPGVARLELEKIGKAAVARALELEPSLAEAHVSRALLLWDEADYAGMEQEFELALSLSPSYSAAHRWYGEVLAEEARVDEALVHFELAEAADPLWLANLFFHANLLLLVGRTEEALERIRRMRELSPTTADHHRLMAQYHIARGEIEPALKEIERAEKQASEPRTKPIFRAWYFVVAGESEKATALLHQEESLPEFRQNVWAVAWMYGLLQNRDEFFRWFDRAFQSKVFPLEMYRLDPGLANVRADPRFGQFLKRIKLA